MRLAAKLLVSSLQRHAYEPHVPSIFSLIPYKNHLKPNRPESGMFTNRLCGNIKITFSRGLGSQLYPQPWNFFSGTRATTDHRRLLSGQPFHREHRPRLAQKTPFELPARAIMSGRVPIESQRVDAPLTSSATFLVLSVTDSPEAVKTVRSALADIDGLAKNVAIRDLGASFACTVGIGSDVWDKVTRLPRPSELHPFPVVKGAKRK